MKTKTNDLENLRKKIEELELEKTNLELKLNSIKESAKKFEELFYSAPLPYQSLDINGKIIEINPKWLEEFHYERDEVINHSISEFIAPDYKEKLSKDFPKFKETGYIRDLQQVIVTKEGKRIELIVNGNACYDKNGNFLHTHCILKNVTEINKAKEELEFKKELYDSIVNKNLDGITLIDKNANIVSWNSALENITGLSRDDALRETAISLFFKLLPKEFTMLYNEEQVKNNFQKFQKTELDNKTDRFFDIPIINLQNNNTIICQILIFSFNTSRGVLTCCILRDINERVEALNKQIEIEGKLKQTIMEKDKFFSIMAHDLKNPIIGFTGLTKMLVEDFSDLTLSEINDLVDAINKSAFNLNQLLENLLEWSRIQRGAILFNPTKCNLKELVDEIILYHKANFDLKKITIINEIPSNIFVFIDVNMIGSVIGNLLSNAIKFSYENGKVIVSSKQKNNKLHISVKDFGVGIEEHNLNKLFKLDEQFTSFGTAKEKGTGLGLILCKEHLEKHKGDLKVKSKYGEGSEFTFILPSEKINTN